MAVAAQNDQQVLLEEDIVPVQNPEAGARALGLTAVNVTFVVFVAFATAVVAINGSVGNTQRAPVPTQELRELQETPAAAAAPAAAAGVPAAAAAAGVPAAPEGGEEVPEFPYWIDKCAWSGDDDCSKKKCCNQENYQCMVQNEYFAGCQLTTPEDWDGTVLGGFRGWEAPKAPEGECAGHSLWCVTVVTTDEEQALLDAQKENGVGLYQCDDYSIFPGAPAPMGEWKSLANTDVFINIWENNIKKDDKWKQFDWTVKVDIDLVFFPDRLRWHIDKLCAPKKQGIYLKNTDFKWGFLGSLEVFSKEAMRMYYHVGYKCAENIGHNSGEDGYMKGCMDAIGAASMTDITLLDDKYTIGGFSGWAEDNCQSGATVGFHPFKTEWVWEACHDAASLLSDPDRQCIATGCDR